MAATSRRKPSLSLPLTPRLVMSLAVGSLLVSFVTMEIAAREQARRVELAQLSRVGDVAASLAMRAAPMLAARDDLRLAMMAASAAQFGHYRVLLLDADGVVRIDTGVALGGRRVQLLTTSGAFTRQIDEERSEHLAPALGAAGRVGEVRIRFPKVPSGELGVPWPVFGGAFLACLSLLCLAGVISHHWMGHVREAAATAQAMAHGELSARCERRAGGVIRDLQDSLHDMSGALGEGVQQVQRSFLELASQVVEVLERRGCVGHAHRTCTYAMLLASRLGLTPQECRDLETAAQLHDLGEIFEPPEQADAPPDERQIVRRMRRIPQRGAELIQGFSNLSRVAEIVRHHRECFDGTGYPHGLRGERIPLGARILGIADAFDQLTTVCPPGGRPLRWPEALDALHADRGDTFDPWLVDLFDEEIRKHPDVVEEAPTVMISTAGVVPYKALHTDREGQLLEETSISWEDEDWARAELEVYEDGMGGGDA